MKKVYTLLLVALCLVAVGCKQQQKPSDMKFRPLGNTGLMVSDSQNACGILTAVCPRRGIAPA